MKATQRDFARTAKGAAAQCRYFFFCGPDEAGAAAAADTLAGMLDDPGEKVELSGGDLKRDPALLGDEARSSSLFGETRHIRVRASGDEMAEPLRTLIEQVEADGVEPCPVLVVATSATDKSRTAKLLEKRKDALVAMFYQPTLHDFTPVVRQMADKAGLRLDGDIAERIARGTGLDSRLAQSEIDKLALYLDASIQSPKVVDAEVLGAIGATTEEDGFMPLVNAVLSGEAHKLPAEMRRMREVGLNSVGLVLAMERRAAQLAGLAARMGPRGDIQSFIEGEKRARRIFFKDERDLAVQLRAWRGPKLARLTQRLVDLHRRMLGDSRSADVLLVQELTAIARQAAPRR
ncbi:DNA polymerase III subunit delta [Alteriqipengyuania sp. WL0013]|uniref:DNA polymerase III subunit delta n=1 Tax=Alteriqipengyuania sp. WL0013 TaxID=3110773 RepID=UPI002B934F23|nr:DNA polymerase III subunit delta [Alteriqipengyuania sp. WL0013]MEB3416495.1 DNA polymerase III subunit delta [Alteriqipengyuania sp. WL0013]